MSRVDPLSFGEPSLSSAGKGASQALRLVGSGLDRLGSFHALQVSGLSAVMLVFLLPAITVDVTYLLACVLHLVLCA